MTLILFLQLKHVLTSTYSANYKIKRSFFVLSVSNALLKRLPQHGLLSRSFKIPHSLTIKTFVTVFYNLLCVKSKKTQTRRWLTTFIFFVVSITKLTLFRIPLVGTNGHRKIYFVCGTVWILTRRLQLDSFRKGFTSILCSAIFFFPEVRYTPLSSAVVDRWRRYYETVTLGRTFTTLP